MPYASFGSLYLRFSTMICVPARIALCAHSDGTCKPPGVTRGAKSVTRTGPRFVRLTWVYPASPTGDQVALGKVGSPTRTHSTLKP